MLYPLTFHPIFKERIWGGRKLEQLYHKAVPAGKLIGESWEISDRPEGVSVIANGSATGKDLHWLMEQHGDQLLGTAKASNGRFPVLIKILDARDKLSLQVHPPASLAAGLGGAPKSELWYVTDAAENAEIFVGLKPGIDRAGFEREIKQGTVADCFHRLKVRPGDAVFLPSGRVHALGAGVVLYEIQQNSDTTYRVFDWNRLGLDGQPRQLHVSESLASINFDDFEPPLIGSDFSFDGPVKTRQLVRNPLFNVRFVEMPGSEQMDVQSSVPLILGVIQGGLSVGFREQQLQLRAGQFCMIPANLAPVRLKAQSLVQWLETEVG